MGLDALGNVITQVDVWVQSWVAGVDENTTLGVHHVEGVVDVHAAVVGVLVHLVLLGGVVRHDPALVRVGARNIYHIYRKNCCIFVCLSNALTPRHLACGGNTLSIASFIF